MCGCQCCSVSVWLSVLVCWCVVVSVAGLVCGCQCCRVGVWLSVLVCGCVVVSVVIVVSEYHWL